jgi:protein-S-isoprenylcysteine O-methyltransferase Ste14
MRVSEAAARWTPMIGALWLLAATGGLALARARADRISPLVASSHENKPARTALMALGIMLCGYAVVAGLAPGLLAYAGPIPTLERPIVRWLGVLGIFVGVAITFSGQLQMGRSWRVGVPDAAPAGLVTTGLFRISRNPIYLGVATTLLGVVLCAPTWLGLALWIAAGVAGNVYVRSEERFLAASFGDAWTEYRRRVRRWL